MNAPFKVSVDPVTSVRVADVVGAVIVSLLMLVAVATPSTGVTRVGEVANTATPVPVSSVMAAAKLALEGVANHVAMPVPSPDTPVEIGRPVRLVATPEAGVPSTGAVITGPVSVLLVSVCVATKVTSCVSVPPFNDIVGKLELVGT